MEDSSSVKEQKNRTITKDIFAWLYKAIVVLSPFGLILSIVFFLIEAKESEEMVGNLSHIEQSLSTRHIGIFPDYLDNINKVLSETSRSGADTAQIIIFEDVLFYGAFYNGSAFKEMLSHLVELSNLGTKIVIAYYNNENSMRNGRMFREVVQESWIRQQDLENLSHERREMMSSLRTGNTPRANIFTIADSLVSEKYFVRYRDNEQKDFSKRIEKILTPLYDQTKKDFSLFLQLDSIKNLCLNKPAHSISFNDIYTLYYEVTEELKTFFAQHNIKLIPLNNYLTMSCWSNGEKVLFAFPGKFAADEIGFISSDRAILDYIHVMLEGIENSLKDEND
jgi:hypothetical protein